MESPDKNDSNLYFDNVSPYIRNLIKNKLLQKIIPTNKNKKTW